MSHWDYIEVGNITLMACPGRSFAVVTGLAFTDLRSVHARFTIANQRDQMRPGPGILLFSQSES